MQQPEPVLRIEQLERTFGKGPAAVRALRGVTFNVQKGEFLAIMGPSGSGKSTMMNLLGCLARPSQGRYWVDGVEVSRMDDEQLADLRNQKLGFVFQGFHLLPRATAAENVELPLLYRGMPHKQRRLLCHKVMESVGLGHRLDHYPAQMSGGEQQRVAIARALVTEPTILLADEPTGNLDSKTSLKVMQILQELNDQGLTILLVTHETEMATFVKRVIHFRDGLLVSDEPVAKPERAEDALKRLDQEVIFA
ncbi:MAG: ABC transporter ATP-binding protein [Vulcanimicrobiota bacterium]